MHLDGFLRIARLFTSYPVLQVGVHPAAVVQLHGSLPPAGSLSAALIACDGFITLGLWLDRSLIIPIDHHIDTGYHSVPARAVSRSPNSFGSWRSPGGDRRLSQHQWDCTGLAEYSIVMVHSGIKHLAFLGWINLNKVHFVIPDQNPPQKNRST